MKASIVIRTLNESKHLPELLEGIRTQDTDGLDTEVVVVDSGSTDGTLDIARSYAATIVHIERRDFSFGRSLNLGCRASTGEYLVFISGHCIPVETHWLRELLEPLRSGAAVYSYGRQVGGESSRFSEKQLFRKYFPEVSRIPQTDSIFVNNANSALVKSIWEEHPFDEELTGLEDMELAKRLVSKGYRIAYVASAPVYHLHDESWGQVRRRYERESIALQSIMPEVHLRVSDVFRYYVSAVLLDTGAAFEERQRPSIFRDILLFRLMQFWGSYRGNHEHRRLSRAMKDKYFYPR